MRSSAELSGTHMQPGAGQAHVLESGRAAGGSRKSEVGYLVPRSRHINVTFAAPSFISII